MNAIWMCVPSVLIIANILSEFQIWYNSNLIWEINYSFSEDVVWIGIIGAKYIKEAILIVQKRQKKKLE